MHNKEQNSTSPWLDADQLKREVSIEAVLNRYEILEALK